MTRVAHAGLAIAALLGLAGAALAAEPLTIASPPLMARLPVKVFAPESS